MVVYFIDITISSCVLIFLVIYVPIQLTITFSTTIFSIPPTILDFKDNLIIPHMHENCCENKMVLQLGLCP